MSAAPKSWVWNTDGQDTPTLASVSETSVDGLRSPQASYGLTNTSQRVCLGEGQCLTTNTAPDGTYTVTVQQAGHVTSVTRYSPSAQTLSATTYTYDAHGRRSSVTDARTGTTGYTYDSADRVLSITTPAPGSAGGPPAPSGGSPGGPQTTTTLYDTLSRPWKTIQPDGTSVTNTYHATGERQRTSGSRTYPVEYTYDHAGRMKTMKTGATSPVTPGPPSPPGTTPPSAASSSPNNTPTARGRPTPIPPPDASPPAPGRAASPPTTPTTPPATSRP